MKLIKSLFLIIVATFSFSASATCKFDQVPVFHVPQTNQLQPQISDFEICIERNKDQTISSVQVTFVLDASEKVTQAAAIDALFKSHADRVNAIGAPVSSEEVMEMLTAIQKDQPNSHASHVNRVDSQAFYLLKRDVTFEQLLMPAGEDESGRVQLKRTLRLTQKMNVAGQVTLSRDKKKIVAIDDVVISYLVSHDEFDSNRFRSGAVQFFPNQKWGLVMIDGISGLTFESGRSLFVNQSTALNN